VFLVCVLLLGGCSAKFAYNNASWLVYWYIDDYVELNNDQEDMFDVMLERWLTWHKNEELPKYQRHLNDIISDLETNNINEQTIAAHRERGRQHWIRSRTHVAPDLVTLGKTLSSEQITELFLNLEEENIEDEEEINETLALSEQDRIDEWTEKNQKNIKKWTGRLSKEQQELIASFYHKFDSTGQHWLAYKREYQQQLKGVFELQERDEAFEKSLYSLIVDPERFRTQTFQTAMETNTQASTEYMLALLAITTDKQLKKVVEEIAEYKEDVIALQK